MAGPIYITDLGECQPQSALTNEAKRGCWSLWDYETEQHNEVTLSGRMLYADSQAAAPVLTLSLGVSGWHEIYLGFYYSDFPTDHHIRLRLSGAGSFDRVSAEPTSVKDGNHTEQNISHRVLAETLWRAADLSGKSLEIARPNTEGVLGRDGYSSLAYVKLVPLSPAQLANHHKLDATEQTKKLVAIYDGAGTVGWGPQAIEDLWEDIDPLAETDINILLCTMSRFDITYYPSKIGEMRSLDRGFYHKPYATQARMLDQLSSRGIDPLRVYIDRAKQKGLKFFATTRLAGPHTPPWHVTGQGPFYRQNPQCRCVTQDGRVTPHLSLAFPQVRQRLVDVLTEQAQAGADGVAVMFNRGAPWILFEDQVWDTFAKAGSLDRDNFDPLDERWCQHKASFITELMRQLRQAMDEVGKGRHVGIGCIVMGTRRNALYFGIDAEAWMRQGLVDFLVVHPYNFLEKPFDEPMDSVEETIRQLRPVANETGVKLYADVYPRRMPGYAYLERARLMYAAGADGLAYWDIESRVNRKSEWNTSSRLGHVDQLDDWPLDLRSHFDRIPLKSVAGMMTEYRYGGHTNG